MSLQHYWLFLRAHWRALVALVLVGLAAGAGATVLIPPSYTSTSKALVTVSARDASVLDLSQGNSFAQNTVETYAEVATSSKVLQPVADRLGLGDDMEALAKRISIGTSTSTTVMDIAVQDRNPTRAADIANAVTAELSSVVADLTEAADGTGATVQVSQLASAEPAKGPTTPNLLVDLLVGAVAGLLVGLAVIGVRRLVWNRVESFEDIEHVTGLAVAGEIARDGRLRRQPLPAAADPTGAFSESVRSLRTNLQFLVTDSEAPTIVVTSASVGEGKTTLTTNLAVSLASSQSTVLVDADLRRPRVASVFGLDGSIGLSDVLAGRARLEDALQEWGSDGLRVLPAGTRPPNPTDLLQSEAMGRLIDTLSERFDTVLFDCPPSAGLSDARVLARQCSGALVVAALQRTKRSELSRAAGNLERSGARLLGVVATFVPARRADYYYYAEDEGRSGSPSRSRPRPRRGLKGMTDPTQGGAVGDGYGA